MEINRSIQLGILKHLASFYPNRPPIGLWEKLLEIANNNEEVLNANLYYLYEQNCINQNCLSQALGSPGPEFCEGLIRITHIGQDILQGDGGISAIKNTVTVRFHEDALNFLERCIERSPQDQHDKKTLVAKLRELPASAIEHLMKKVLDAAAECLPDAYQLIEKLLR